METEAKLRRLHHIEKMTIKALARQTGMSRNTIRRVLRADKAGHFYQRKIQPMPALGAYIDTLIAWLARMFHKIQNWCCFWRHNHFASHCYSLGLSCCGEN